MPPGGGAPDYRGDRSHEVLEQVDDVDGLGHQAAAALELGGAAPGRPPVVGRGPARLVEGVGQPDLPEPPAAEQLPEHVRDPPEAHLEDHPEPNPALPAVLNHPLAGLDRRFQGLFDQHVAPGVRRGEGHLRVEARGTGDDHHLHLRIGDQIAVVGGGPGVPVLGGEGADPLRIAGADRGQEPALDELQLAGAEAARHPGPDQAEPDRLAVSAGRRNTARVHSNAASAGVRGR